MQYDTAEEVIRQANRGLISINEKLEVCEGYDGPVDPHWYDENDGRLPAAERVKLADAMIARWQAYKDEALSDSSSLTA